jgi:Glycosyl hydrolases family 16
MVLLVSQIDRRQMMLMAGMGLMAAAIPVPQAQAIPSQREAPADLVQPPAAPPPTGAAPVYIFQDEFDGPAGSAPDPGKWIVWNWDADVFPPLVGHYRNDRRNVFVDGNSNLVIRATREDDEYFTGKLQANWRGMINTTWEARIKFNCMTTGAWPAYWTVNEDPEPDGEVDIVEWYGNGNWPPGTTVHAASNGKTWEGRSIPSLVDGDWHNWRMRWDEDGFKFWRDYVDGAKPYFSVPPKPIQVSGRPGDYRWPFNNPGYWMFPVLNLAVGGPGAGDPALGNFPADMLVDWIRIW